MKDSKSRNENENVWWKEERKLFCVTYTPVARRGPLKRPKSGNCYARALKWKQRIGSLHAIRATATWNINRRNAGCYFICVVSGKLHNEELLWLCDSVGTVQWRKMESWCHKAAILRVYTSVKSWGHRHKIGLSAVNVSVETENTGKGKVEWEELIRTLVKCRVCKLEIAL
jgi:hypothetical protein